jgi:integrase
MKLSQYLFRRSSGHYYFRMRTPRALSSKIKTKEIKFSLKTTNRSEAQKRVLPYASFIARIESMTDIDEIVRQLQASGIQTTKFGMKGLKTGSVSIAEVEVDPRVEGDVDGFIKTVKEIQLDTPVNKPEQLGRQQLPNSKVKLQDVINEFVDEAMSGDEDEKIWTPKTRDENIQIYNLLLRILGSDVCVSDLGYETGRTVKKIVRKLPANINKSPKYRDKSINEIIDMKDKPRAIDTFNKIMGRYATLFDYAMRHGYIKDNYFEKLTIKTTGSQKEKRASFNNDQLVVVFDHLNAIRSIHSYSYWLPRIALYAGMRLNEIAQLYLSDIREEEGTYIFDINDEDDNKRLKTPACKRWVPVHSKLIEMGLLDRVEELKRHGKTRLFYELKYDGNNYGKAVSGWFGRVRAPLGWVNLKPKLDFHSFRCNATTALQRSDVPEYRVNAILGHEAETESFARYGDGFAMSTVKQDIEKIVFQQTGIHVPSPVFKIR